MDKPDKITLVINGVVVDISASEVASIKGMLRDENASQCDICKSVANWIIAQACAAGGCAAAGALIAGLFTAAEIIFFPEGEEVLIPLEAVTETLFETLCNEFGFEWLKGHTMEAAAQCCQKAGLC